MNRCLGKKAVVISLVCFIFGWGTGAGVLPVQAVTTSGENTGKHIVDKDALTREADALFSMSFDDLMHVRIQAGTITGISENKSPVARTVITSRDIALTPARSILDLIEVYVPGATFVNHFNGPRFGIRGVLGDQNYHYLLLVNGKNMNFKAQDGALVEIFNRDLNDIREIEIIRGPGSVTYGPGAIGGIINILTHTADTRPGVSTGIELNTENRC
nr:TonB-dependent receptor plug domain-containing protein [uncultured Desulfobacter sp.]